MFQARSDVKDAFERFRPITSSAELWESKALQRHGMAVMSVIDDIIINLDDENYVIDLILEQGSKHARFYGFRPQLFWVIRFGILLTTYFCIITRKITTTLIRKTYSVTKNTYNAVLEFLYICVCFFI